MNFQNSGKVIWNLTAEEATMKIGIVTLDDIMQHGLLNLLNQANFIAVENKTDFSQFIPRNRTSETCRLLCT